MRTLLERQAHGHEAAAHQPHQLGALISAELLRQRQVLEKALRDVSGALEAQQMRHQEAVGQELQGQADTVRQLFSPPYMNVPCRFGVLMKTTFATAFTRTR